MARGRFEVEVERCRPFVFVPLASSLSLSPSLLFPPLQSAFSPWRKVERNENFRFPFFIFYAKKKKKLFSSHTFEREGELPFSSLVCLPGSSPSRWDAAAGQPARATGPPTRARASAATAGRTPPPSPPWQLQRRAASLFARPLLCRPASTSLSPPLLRALCPRRRRKRRKTRRKATRISPLLLLLLLLARLPRRASTDCRRSSRGRSRRGAKRRSSSRERRIRSRLLLLFPPRTAGRRSLEELAGPPRRRENENWLQKGRGRRRRKK